MLGIQTLCLSSDPRHKGWEHLTSVSFNPPSVLCYPCEDAARGTRREEAGEAEQPLQGVFRHWGSNPGPGTLGSWAQTTTELCPKLQTSSALWRLQLLTKCQHMLSHLYSPLRSEINVERWPHAVCPRTGENLPHSAWDSDLFLKDNYVINK